MTYYLVKRSNDPITRVKIDIVAESDLVVSRNSRRIVGKFPDHPTARSTLVLITAEIQCCRANVVAQYCRTDRAIERILKEKCNAQG